MLIIIVISYNTSLYDFPRDLVISSCELIATASQNNLRCQQAFSRTTSKLLQVVGNSAVESSVRTKALYAVSCK